MYTMPNLLRLLYPVIGGKDILFRLIRLVTRLQGDKHLEAKTNECN